MPLTCDCFPGCWGAHSKDWPLVVNPFLDREEVRKTVMAVVPYGSYVTVEEGTKVENESYLSLVYGRMMESAYSEIDAFEQTLADLAEYIGRIRSTNKWGVD